MRNSGSFQICSVCCPSTKLATAQLPATDTTIHPFAHTPGTVKLCESSGRAGGFLFGLILIRLPTSDLRLLTSGFRSESRYRVNGALPSQGFTPSAPTTGKLRKRRAAAHHLEI